MLDHPAHPEGCEAAPNPGTRRTGRSLKGAIVQELVHAYLDARPVNKLDDAEWHVFTVSQYDPKTGEWHMVKLPVHHIIE
jgi:hypothetical protein